MHKKIWTTWLIALCVIFTLATISHAKVVTLTFSDQNSKMGWGPVHALQPWAKDVEKATGGKIKIQIYPSQSLSKTTNNWNAVKNGIADIAWCFHGYWPDMTPLADVISLPGMPVRSSEHGSEAVWKLYEKFPTFQKQFQENHILLLYTSDPYILMTTKKPVKVLEDMKGLKLRTPGGPPTAQMKALEAIPMMIPMPEAYMAMQKGVIDGFGAPWEAILAWRFYEVAKYYTNPPLPVAYFSIAMNKNKWNSLPKETQEAMMSVCGLKGAKFWGRNFFDTCKEAVFEAAKKTNHEINLYELPDEERARWVDASCRSIWEKWVKDMNDKGYKDAREILNAALELLK